jgi:O-antigen/teichoic acid export membrane protein
MFAYIKKLLSETLIYGLSGVSSGLLTILFVPIYTRIFSPEDYGVMGLVTTTMALLSILIVLSLDNSAHRWYWDTEDINDQKTTLASWTWCQIVVSLIFAGLIFILSPWIGSALVKQDDAGLYLRLAAMTLPLGVLNMVVANWLRMQRRPWTTVAFSVGNGLFNFLLTIILVVFFHQGLKGVYVAQVVTVAIGSVVAAALLGDWVSLQRFQWRRLLAMLKYGLPMIPAGLAYWIVNLSGRYFVQGYSSIAEVGLYQVGSTIAAMVALVTGAFQLAWGPFAMSIHKQPDAKKVYANVLLAYLWTTCLISTVISLFAPEILSFFTTEFYYDAGGVVSLLSFNYVVVGLGYIASIGPTIAKTTKPYGVALIAAGGLTVMLNLILVPRFGKEGSAAATLIAQSIVPVYVFYRSQKLYPIPFRFGTALGIFVFAFLLASLGGRFSVTNPVLAIGIKILFISIFFSTLFMLRVVSFEQARHFLLSLHRGTKE